MMLHPFARVQFRIGFLSETVWRFQFAAMVMQMVFCFLFQIPICLLLDVWKQSALPCYKCLSGPGFLRQNKTKISFRISIYHLQIKTVYLFILSLSAYPLSHFFFFLVLLSYSGLRIHRAVVRAILVPDLISCCEASSFPTLLRVLFSF